MAQVDHFSAKLTWTGAAKRLHEQAHEHCFIANSVNFPVSCDARVSVADTV